MATDKKCAKQCQDGGCAKKQCESKCEAKKAAVFGSPEYLVARFDDIQGATEMSRWCSDTKKAKEVIGSLSTHQDGMRVHKVYRAEVFTPGDEVKGTSTIVHVALGLNGGGSQSDYLAALKRLADTGMFHIFDCWIDSLDDLVDVLCTFTPAAAKSAKASKSAKKGKSGKGA